ncbi:hypothetical protein [Fodinibius halophilus]|uniref:Uncharacterized protein n=1 Tax=Fodinibius halophilus TaxID=1736908 RepID=A0A6M1T1H7_9BACT|nr:hypothetical protein [Fodinibius halophilus]NGP89928.1 hypothetical protein [Fodinibius halophilus]
MQSKKWKNYLFEGTLIVFSVMLALFLNQVVQNIETSRQKEKAINKITAELERNLSVLENWLTVHDRIRIRTEQIVAGESDSLKQQLIAQPFFNLQILTDDRSFIDSNLSSTAWETAKSTDIVNEFNFETVETLTGVYALQDVIFNQTIQDISKIFFERETHNLENIDATLIQFQLRFSELVGQERLLIEYYREVIDGLK